MKYSIPGVVAATTYLIVVSYLFTFTLFAGSIEQWGAFFQMTLPTSFFLWFTLSNFQLHFITIYSIAAIINIGLIYLLISAVEGFLRNRRAKNTEFIPNA